MYSRANKSPQPGMNVPLFHWEKGDIHSGLWGFSFFLRRQPRDFENITLVARRREHFRVLLAIFLVAQLSPKRVGLVHKNSLASCEQCHHSVEPRALTSPFKHSDLIVWSLLTGHPTHEYL